ncbi:CLUMA_CG008502, isoform A [Clunio marinus]|uniref:CLUMA_CG008502, isoform A n=1 Tax=Clunio marinus TaxID=568069 RepID=A0A1J1I3Y6_9DIPT|nr:CLUMA_CG008502, isoform A [Clunio marinus]
MENKVQINLNIKPTKALGTKLVTSLFDYLLHLRSQIPFQFKLFVKFVNAKSKLNVKENEENLRKDWKTEKQLKLARETCDKIFAIKKVIEEEFSTGSPMMILFGSTIHTAKESYLINFPKVNDDLLPTYVNETSEVKKILLKIIQNDDLRLCDKTSLGLTNIFVLFRKVADYEISSDFIELPNFKVSKSCNTFSLNFRDSTDFDIFDEEFQELTLSEVTAINDSQEVWYQSKTFVKGFKDILVHSKSIWT